MKRKKTGLAYLKRRIVLDLAFQGRLLTSSYRRLPDFIVFGAQKCGSTSVYDYVKHHPQIIPAYKKAAHYFDMNYSQGLSWYRAHFPLKSANPAQARSLTGEASPYYIFHPLAAERAASLVPNVKLIALLRNPVNRAYSHYHHMLRTKREELTFEEALEAEESRLAGVEDQILTDDEYTLYNHRNYSYKARGMYADQLARWFRFFPREQFLILKSEDFFRNPAQTCSQIYQFLDLPDWDLGHYENANPGGYPPMNPLTRQRLNEYFRPHNQRLYEMVGIDFGWDK
jgi:hypothetical protein